MQMFNSRYYRSVFAAMVERDLLAQWRDKGEFIFRVMMLPAVLIIIYGYILPAIGMMPDHFQSQMFWGMVGMSILITGIHGTAIPFTMDFNNRHEIEDRLQAPVPVNLIALAKMAVGIIEAFIGGLLVGTIVKPMEIAAMFPGFLMPLVFTGAIFFSWGALSSVPVFQVLVLLNPLVYANEALRYVTIPQLVSMPLYFSLLGLFISTVLMAGFGFRRFHHMASSQNGR